MTISPARASALRGLALQQRRLAASASNVANANTEGYRALRVEAISEPRGGVDSRLEATTDPGPIVIDEDGRARELSSTSFAAERVAQLQATHAFAANVQVARTADELDRAALDLKG